MVLLYHITHIDNLRSILQNNGLLAQAIVQEVCIGFATMNAKMQQELKTILDEFNIEIPIGVRRQFYF